MQSDSAMNGIVLVSLLEMPIHIGINQAEYNGFISYKCLVVTFGVRNGFLVFAAVDYFPEHARRFPVLINLLFDGFNPIIGNIHCHAIVESVSSVFCRSSQSGHARYFFGNGNGFGIYLMNEFIGQCQVADGVIVFVTIEIVTVIAESFSQSVTVIKHGCNTVETESVELILFQPEFTVRQEEVYDFVFTIIEAK